MIPQFVPIYPLSLVKRLTTLIESNSFFSEFKENKAFEEELATFAAADYCVTCTSGSMALTLALMAVEVGPGDEVIVPNLTMIATANAVRVLGATPVFCDVESETGCLDCTKVESLITDKTKAVIYVTLNGRMNVSALRKLYLNLTYRRIALIKDDAQSLGSQTEMRISLQDKVFGDIHTTSFSHYKLISTGQGGAMLTSSPKLAENLRRLKNHGRLDGGDDVHTHFGINSKFSDLLAAVGREQLRDIEKLVSRKKEIYDLYLQGLKEVEQVFMLPRHEYHLPWMVDIYTEYRDDLFAYLFLNDVQTRRMYPPCNSQMCYDVPGDFPVSKILAKRGLWLPSSPSISNDEISKVCKTVKEFFNEKK